MKIRFLGTGAAFTANDNYHSNMLLTAVSGKRLLIDCGSDIRHSLAESGMAIGNIGAELDGVYISHNHSDHCGGLEFLALSSYFGAGRGKLKLFAEERLLRDLWDTSLQGGLCCIQGKEMGMADYFSCRPVTHNGRFSWEGIRLELVPMPHIVYGDKVKYSYGLLMGESDSGGYEVFISSDSQFRPDVVTAMAKKVGLLFHDCETTPFRSGVHAHYDELLTLPDGVRNRMWLYHYNADPPYDAEKDGFAGFVTKGQEFDGIGRCP